jgi:tetratricopeptide (TPR) repeat protein
MNERDRPYSAVRVDELDPVAVAGVRWHGVRRALGVTAFGVNAYSAEAGEEVVEDHDETGGGSGRHEELYVVLSGRAAFTVAGEEIDAPPGTLVFVRDPAARRHAVAREPRTTVLALGGRAGAALPVSPWEYWFAAHPAYDAGDYDRAVEIASEGLADHPDHPTLHYQLACYHALAGRRDEALAHLRRAFEGDPRTREWAAGDADLDSLRDDPLLAG